LFQIINIDFSENIFSRFQVRIIQSWNGIAFSIEKLSDN
jgi:hypothetical protein